MTKKDQTTIKVGKAELAMLAFSLSGIDPVEWSLSPDDLATLKRLESKVWRALDRLPFE
jgi:hypothetical protein